MFSGSREGLNGINHQDAKGVILSNLANWPKLEEEEKEKFLGELGKLNQFRGCLFENLFAEPGIIEKIPLDLWKKLPAQPCFSVQLRNFGRKPYLGQISSIMVSRDYVKAMKILIENKIFFKIAINNMAIKGVSEGYTYKVKYLSDGEPFFESCSECKKIPQAFFIQLYDNKNPRIKLTF